MKKMFRVRAGFTPLEIESAGSTFVVQTSNKLVSNNVGKIDRNVLKTHSSLTGFTLIEILVVIAIIGILASVIMPSVNEARDKALVAATIVELDGIKTAFQMLHDDTGYYPNNDTSYCRTTLPGTNEINLSTANAGLTANGLGWTDWKGPYISDVTDTWGSPYYLDEDYDCMTATEGCKGVNDGGTNASSVIVSCGPNKAISNGSCAYDTDNVVYRLCD